MRLGIERVRVTDCLYSEYVFSYTFVTQYIIRTKSKLGTPFGNHNWLNYRARIEQEWYDLKTLIIYCM